MRGLLSDNLISNIIWNLDKLGEWREFVLDDVKKWQGAKEIQRFRINFGSVRRNGKS